MEALAVGEGGDVVDDINVCREGAVHLAVVLPLYLIEGLAVALRDASEM